MVLGRCLLRQRCTCTLRKERMHQGVTLALAHSPRRVSKVLGKRKSSITHLFGEYDFHCQEII